MFEECLYFNINKLTRQINRVWENAYRSTGLSPSHAYLLHFILEQPGITPNALAGSMDLKFSTVTRFIDSLVAKGLVERRKESKDKRESNIYATKNGQLLKVELESISTFLHKNIREMLGSENVSDVIHQIRDLNRKISAT